MNSRAEPTAADVERILVASSQVLEPLSEPPRKRRRIEQLLPDSDDDNDFESASQDSIDLPSQNQELIEVDDELLENERSKYEHVMHEPAYVESQKNIFVTQVDQPWSSPSRIRGPRWRKKSATPSPSPSPEETRPQEQLFADASFDATLIADDFEDDEIENIMATEDLGMPFELPQANMNMVTFPPQNAKSMRQTTLFGMHTTQRDNPARLTATQSHNYRLSERVEPPTHHKLNEEAMQKWIFPLNVGTIRDYQYNIVHKALYNNILVALPTGLGKTFIAAAVMMNWYNWTKDAQIVFMAPTKPLVAQQIDACFHIAGIPRSQTTLMTGEIPSAVRAEEWLSKRVFFMTPQTMINDLKTGIADPKRIVLVVVDEAHKATGNYAYCEVIKFLHRFNNSFRVLGLTATPGSKVESVQNVIDGLGIARVEIRTEDSIDIQPFVHSRDTALQYFDYTDEIHMCLELFSKAVKPVMDKLCSQNGWWGKDPTAITLYGLMTARNQWMKSEAGRKANPGLKAMMHSCFTPLMSLAHNLELLKFHGIGPFYHKMKQFQDDDTVKGKYKKSITESPHFVTLMSRMRTWIQDQDFVGHPKIEYLNSVVLNHFLDAGNGVGRAAGRPPSDTRIMIFTHYRDSAEEICRVLNRHKPMIRPHVFVGQSSTKGSDGMDQKKQTEIIKQFKAGTYNTLVATSIGEEGLDIGEVDLIVCYDCSKSPIRMLQRMGRTGRKRAGNIVMLLMRGKEERDYVQAKDNYAKMQELIESGRDFNFHEEESPRIVPKGTLPVVSKERIEIPIENTQPGSVEPRKSKGRKLKKPAKKFNMPDNVETGFTFLGSNGGKGKKEKQTDMDKPKRRKVMLDEEIAPEIADDKVVLSTEQELELDAKYASIAGEEEQYIQLVEVRNHPDRLKSLSKIGLVKHSTTTEKMLRAFKAASTNEDYTGRPYELLEEDEVDILPSMNPRKYGAAEKPFYVSQGKNVPVASQNDDLPELDSLFGRTPASGAAAQGRRAKRRVVSDDEDEE